MHNERLVVVVGAALLFVAAPATAAELGYVLVSAETLSQGPWPQVLLPNGQPLPWDALTTAALEIGPSSAEVIAIGLEDGAVYADTPGAFRPAEPFRTTPLGTSVARAGEVRFRSLGAGESVVAALAPRGAVGFRSGCPPASSACPADFDTGELFADGFESGDTAAWSGQS